MTEIVLFACLAIFLGLQLRRVLGRRDDDDPTPPPPSDSQFSMRPTAPSIAASPSRADIYRRPVSDPLADGLAQIRAVDRDFDLAVFLDGAKIAFRMVVEDFIRGDIAGLRQLVDEAVLQSFASAIEAHRAAGEVNHSEIRDVLSADPIAAELDGTLARITVRFVSEQLILLRDPQGQVVEGHPDQPVRLVDDWTFTRRVRADSPNWLLVATHSGDA